MNLLTCQKQESACNKYNQWQVEQYRFGGVQRPPAPGGESYDSQRGLVFRPRYF